MAENRKRNLFFLITVILMSIYLLWRIFFTLPAGVGIPQLLFGILLVTAEMITAMTTFELYYRKIKSEQTALKCPEIPDDAYPHVDVLIATHNEDAELLYKTANACTFLEYPDKDKVHIYFCDDKNRREVAFLAQRLGIGYLGLADNRHAKSGNLNHALSKTSSPLIATFDADMIPRSRFLMETVPYFFIPDCKMGLVQTPQSFYNPDLFQFNLYSENDIPNEQDFFSREVNIMRNSSNAIAYTGSNTVIKRQAMEEIGGFPLNTITEDFETSIRLQKEGYITYATSEVLAAGLTTTDFKSMKKQRIRWAQGVIQSLYNTKAIITPKLSLAARITYLNSYFYWWSFFNRLVFILAPILFALFDFQVAECEFWELMVFWLPAYFFYSLSMRYLSGNIRNNKWSQVIDTIFAPYLVIPVILETVGIHQRKFKVTSKKKTSAGAGDLVYALPHLLLLLLSLAGMVRFVSGKYGWALFYSSVIIFWLGYNMVSLLYAVFFMIGRKSPRKAERIKAEEQLEIRYGGISIPAKTVDLSDEGMLFVHKTPVYIPDDGINITIKTQRYQACLSASIVYVKQMQGAWYYAVTVKPVDEQNKRQYLQIIYDRDHSLPKQMDAWSTTYDDIVRNIYRRIKRPANQRRKYPRIRIEKEILLSDGVPGRLYDFNYHYLSISGLKEEPEEFYTLKLPDRITLILKRTGREVKPAGAELFEVQNLNQLLLENMDFERLVSLLMHYKPYQWQNQAAAEAAASREGKRGGKKKKPGRKHVRSRKHN